MSIELSNLRESSPRSVWASYTKEAIECEEAQAAASGRKKWFEIAKIVAYCAGLVLLAGLAAGLLAPSPYAIVLAPLGALFAVYCILPAARKVKEAIWAIRRLEKEEAGHRTSLEQLKACRKAFEEDSYFNRYADAQASQHPSVKELLELHRKYEEHMRLPEMEFPPELQL